MNDREELRPALSWKDALLRINELETEREAYRRLAVGLAEGELRLHSKGHPMPETVDNLGKWVARSIRQGK